MSRRLLVAAVGALALAGCSPGPAPVATSPRDPSNPSAPEGVSPLAPPGRAEAPADPPAHEHAAPSPGGAPAGPGHAALYACPMHPDVTSSSPSKCPQCGMNLEPKK